MSICIMVKDSNNRPIEGQEVYVGWQSGLSHGRTDSSGIFDTGVSGPCTIRYIRINGKDVINDPTLVLEDRTYPFKRP